MADRINSAARQYGVPLRCANYRGIFTLFASPEPVCNLADARRCDTALYAKIFHAMLDAGYYLPPSQSEVGLVSAAHTAEQVEGFAERLANVLSKI